MYTLCTYFYLFFLRFPWSSSYIDTSPVSHRVTASEMKELSYINMSWISHLSDEYCFVFWTFLIVHLCIFQEIREKVKCLLQDADELYKQSCFHSDGITQWATAVDKRFKDFTSRMTKYLNQLESKLGFPITKYSEVRNTDTPFWVSHKLWQTCSRLASRLFQRADIKLCSHFLFQACRQVVTNLQQTCYKLADSTNLLQACSNNLLSSGRHLRYCMIYGKSVRNFFPMLPYHSTSLIVNISSHTYKVAGKAKRQYFSWNILELLQFLLWFYLCVEAWHTLARCNFHFVSSLRIFVLFLQFTTVVLCDFQKNTKQFFRKQRVL